jgi:hypothetical protein
MANLYENIPEMQARAAANEQRRKIAESLLVQSQDQVQPFVNTGRMVAPMSITQGLAQMLKAYYAGKGIKSANEGDKALASEHAAKAAEAIAAYKAQSQGVPERAPAPIMPLNGQGPPKPAAGPPVPAVAPDPRGAIMGLLANQYAPPEAKQAATLGETWKREDARLDEDRTLRRDNAMLAAETRLYDIQQRMQDRQLTRDQQAALAAEANATRMAIASMGNNLRTEPAPAYAEIIDPKDPSRMLKIDGRLYKGGSLGDPGVVGIAGKEPASAKAAETRGTGGKAVDEQVANLRDLYDQLDKGGGIVNPDKGAIANSAAWVKSSAAGQLGGRIVGTKNQSARSQVAQQRPLLLRAIMSATGMSARSLDSNAELKLWLSAATDPTLDVAANRAALDNIERQYGSAAVGKPDGGVAPAAPTGGALKFDAQGNQIP